MRYEELRNKIVVVTGAGGNFGQAIATDFARQGAVVIACDVQEQAAAGTVRLIQEEGGKAEVIAVDISQAQSVQRLVDAVVARFGRLDVLINNAGVTQLGRPFLADVEESLFDRLIAVNLKGVWLGMKYAIPIMVAQGAGMIVNISSAMGLVAMPGVGIYSATKHGILGLTKAAALEYGQRGVRVNAVCPGRSSAMVTPGITEQELLAREQAARIMSPATGRSGTASEISAAVLFLCSDGASNIHGTALAVDGGHTAQ